MPQLSTLLSTPTVVVVTMLTWSSYACAAGCDNYPYTEGINVEDVQGGTKILATASAIVSFDDVAAIKDARDEALLEAKAQISHFLSEGIKSDAVTTKAVSETKSMQGANKENVRKEVIERVKKLQSSSQALLRGVVPLADCYTKGSEVRVTVGIKPATIKQAERSRQLVLATRYPHSRHHRRRKNPLFHLKDRLLLLLVMHPANRSKGQRGIATLNH